jgi:hypothetical protein
MSNAILNTWGGRDTVDGKPRDLYLQTVTRHSGGTGNAIRQAAWFEGRVMRGASKGGKMIENLRDKRWRTR